MISRKRSQSMPPRTKNAHKKCESACKLNLNLRNNQRCESKTINLKYAADHTKLIKLLCRTVLDGTIRLSPHHVAGLKPHGDFIRKIAYGEIKYVKLLIRKEARRTSQKRGPILKTVLETVRPILPDLFL